MKAFIVFPEDRGCLIHHADRRNNHLTGLVCPSSVFGLRHVAILRQFPGEKIECVYGPVTVEERDALHRIMRGVLLARLASETSSDDWPLRRLRILTAEHPLSIPAPTLDHLTDRLERMGT